MIMTPKEKAEKLINQFEDIENMGRYSGEHGLSEWSTIELRKQAKQCALILVNEMLDEWFNEGGRLGKQKYWFDVKQEIEKYG